MPLEPEAKLWTAVVLQAWHDRFERPAPALRPSHTGTGQYQAEKALRRYRLDLDEADRFLFDAHGYWATAREEVCAAAGVDEDKLVERAVARAA